MTGFDRNKLVRDYGDIDAEVRACRTDCALFDFSFMSRARISGPGARSALHSLQSRPMDDLPPGRIRYALRTNSDNAVVADLTIWRIDDAVFEVMSGRHEDIEDLMSRCGSDAVCEDLSADSVIYALQGPRSLAALAGLTDVETLARLPYFAHVSLGVAGIGCRIGRLGYTGERGFELIAPRADRESLWGLLRERGRAAGFAAADCLRIEAGFILFANECRVGATPAELGLDRFAGARSEAPRIRLVCFRAETPPRPTMWAPAGDLRRPTNRSEIAVTSACHSPTLDATVGLGFVHRESAQPGQPVSDPTRQFRDFRLIPLPLYDPVKQRPRGAWRPVDAFPDSS